MSMKYATLVGEITTFSELTGRLGRVVNEVAETRNGYDA
jgi:hypothetical protein